MHNKYFLKEKEEILSRIDTVMYENNLSQAKVGSSVGLSKSQVNRILLGKAELSFDFIFAFAKEFCHNDVVFLLTGVSGCTSDFVRKIFENVPLEKQKKLQENLIVIADMLRKF